MKLTIVKREENRLVNQHDILLRVSGNRLYFPRVENPRKVLECGYGTGDWAVSVAEEYEDCEVSSKVDASNNVRASGRSVACPLYLVSFVSSIKCEMALWPLTCEIGDGNRHISSID